MRAAITMGNINSRDRLIVHTPTIRTPAFHWSLCKPLLDQLR